MRVRASTVVAVAICAILAVSVACTGGEEESTPSTTDKNLHKPVKEKTVAEKAEKLEKVSEPVTATLTYIPQGKARTTKEVEYLPAGRKIATMETSKGVVKIELWEDKAPNTVVNFVSLANSGRYDGVLFHRVIDGFMAQTGDIARIEGRPTLGYTIPGEMNADLKHTRGVVSMARVGGDYDSGSSQFFIMFGTASRLDGEYAAFGKVTEGMEVVDSINRINLNEGGNPADADRIVSLRVESVPVEEKTEEK